MKKRSVLLVSSLLLMTSVVAGASELYSAEFCASAFIKCLPGYDFLHDNSGRCGCLREGDYFSKETCLSMGSAVTCDPYAGEEFSVLKMNGEMVGCGCFSTAENSAPEPSDGEIPNCFDREDLVEGQYAVSIDIDKAGNEKTLEILRRISGFTHLESAFPFFLGQDIWMTLDATRLGGCRDRSERLSVEAEIVTLLNEYGVQVTCVHAIEY